MMSSKSSALGALALIVLVGAVGYWMLRDSQPPASTPAAPPPVTRQEEPRVAEPAPEQPVAQAERPAPQPESPPSQPEAEPLLAVAQLEPAPPREPTGPTRAFAVSVVWEASGEGIASATVSARLARSEPAAWSAKAGTDVLGGAFLDFPARWDEIDLEAEATGAVPISARIALPVEQPYVVRMTGGQTIFGRVLIGETSEPAAGAAVVVYDAARLARNWSTKADDQGRYEITYDAEGAYVGASLGTLISRVRTSELNALRVEKGERYGPHDLHLRTGLTLSGFITDVETGAPSAGAEA